jgi:DNA mismatch repair protein MutL
MQRDGHIRLLPIQVANKIAAGEVVERPASVVKELLENAIDAGASRIDVTVTAGGRNLVEVRDNGCGMNRDDALLSLERQATSKIRDVDDIEHIDTLGFRGEAIPSIASVSRFILKTRRAADESGTELTVVGGSLQDVREAGLPPGTTIEVRDLFFNVPARRKFLRAYQTEQAHIRTIFTVHALAHPNIGMSLTSDGRELTRLPPDATLEERVRDLFGPDFCADLRVVDDTSNAIRVHGFVSLPNQLRNDRSEQYIFINGRPATAPVILYALREAYPPLAAERKPIVLLFIEMPPEGVDVNVHPTKREVRFHKPAEVREAIIRAIRIALQRTEERVQNAGVPTIPDAAPHTPSEIIEGQQPIPNQGENSQPPGSATAGSQPTSAEGVAPFPSRGTPLPPSPSFAYPLRVPQAPVGTGLPLFPTSQRQPESSWRPDFSATDISRTPTPSGSSQQAPWQWCRVLGMLEGGYALLETEDGHVTLDPRAARERVLFEQLMANHDKDEAFSQRLLLPETVQLPPADSARLAKHLEVLQAMGFAVDSFGDSDHFVIEALPSLLGDVSCRELLANIAHDLENAGVRRGTEKWREEIIAKAACRVMVGQTRTATLPEIEKLVAALVKTRMPYTCPRGRPTMIFTSYRELDRKFGK